MANKDIEVRKDKQPSSVFEMMPEFENLMDRFFGNRFGSLLSDLPRMGSNVSSNVQETDKCYILSADLPGIPKEDIEINVSGNLLTVHAEQKKESGSERLQNFRRQYRSYHQSFSLPTTINPEHIEAHYDNGVLEIILPKAPQAQAKKIEVQSGKGGFLNRITGPGSEKSSSEQQKTDVKH